MMHDDGSGTRSPPWHCQLIVQERTASAVALDFVALETCPSDTVGCPRGTPFTLHLGCGVDTAWDVQVETWAAGADEVMIVCGATDAGSSWLCLSSGDRHLLLAV
jgi:hypothetical protein